MKKKITLFLFISVVIFTYSTIPQTEQSKSSFTIARVKYGGGGDWYTDPSSLPNLLNFIKENTNIDVSTKEARVEISDEVLFSHPYLYITGHGNIKFTNEEVDKLRTYFTGGGFLHADDCYGMDK